MKNFIISAIGRMLSPLFNKGIGRLPGMLRLYRACWRWFGFKGVRLAKVNDFKLYVICRDWAVAPTMLFAQYWEPEETKICEKYIKPGMVVVDIGAYIGYYSLLASKLVGDEGRVYSFEPSSDCIHILHRNLEINGCKNVKVFEKAVFDKIGDADYYLVYDNPSNSSMVQSLEYYKTIRVITTCLDEELANEKVDFIKMDIEGGEVFALCGMKNIIRNNPDLMMIAEVYPAGLIEAGSTVKQYVSTLQEYFNLFTIDKHGRLDVATLDNIERLVETYKAINLFCRRK